MMEEKFSVLTPDTTYHIYNRANGNEPLFYQERNFSYFLKKYKEHISPIADTFCYCLMPNHFHFLIRIKSEKELFNYFKIDDSKLLSNRTGFENLSGLITKKFSNLFNAYSKAINKQENRKGSLFMRPYKRKKVTDEKYLKKLVHYIHYNPVEARLAKKPEDWKHSSYAQIVKNQTDLILKDELIGLFDDLENFMHFHSIRSQKIEIEFN